MTLTANGARARLDFLTRNIFTGEIRVVEAKFGSSAALVRGQPIVADAIQQTGTALARGRKTIRAFRQLGLTGGSFRRGLAVQGLEFTEQRFPYLERLFEAILFRIGL